MSARENPTFSRRGQSEFTSPHAPFPPPSLLDEHIFPPRPANPAAFTLDANPNLGTLPSERELEEKTNFLNLLLRKMPDFSLRFLDFSQILDVDNVAELRHTGNLGPDP